MGCPLCQNSLNSASARRRDAPCSFVSCRAVLYRTVPYRIVQLSLGFCSSLLLSSPLSPPVPIKEGGGVMKSQWVGRPDSQQSQSRAPAASRMLPRPSHQPPPPPLVYLPSIAPKSSPSFLSLPILSRFLFPYSFFFPFFLPNAFAELNYVCMQLKSKKGLEGLGRGLLQQEQEQDERRPSLSLSLACDVASVPDASAALSCPSSNTNTIKPCVCVCVCRFCCCARNSFRLPFICFVIGVLVFVDWEQRLLCGGLSSCPSAIPVPCF